MIPISDDFLRGSLPPLVTPFRKGAVDREAFERLIRFQFDSGSHGIVVTGTSGEPAMLTTTERIELFHTAVTTSAGRLPVIAATGAHTLEATIELTEAAERAGADAVMVVTPYYSKPPEEGMVRYYRQVAASTGLPVLTYHIPGRAGITVRPEVVERIATESPNIVGVKHSAYDLLWITEVISRLGSQFRVLVGVEELSFPMLAIGASGLVNAAANVAPQAVRSLYEEVAAGNLDEARRLHYALYELNSAVFWDTNPGPVKYLMWKTGLLPDNEHRLPMAGPNEAACRRLDELLHTIRPLLDADRTRTPA
ncbi:4-hydroxy-tetrahydrodipicolinate synthase [Streptomyces sp. NPDC059455]|uniref:4-hydroxy-tetrahydrodipicolinate synthase n=1 Tax=Streptomyces sp. NPDC059455 TaxID=3346837 RepID=UPI0036760231